MRLAVLLLAACGASSTPPPAAAPAKKAAVESPPAQPDPPREATRAIDDSAEAPVAAGLRWTIAADPERVKLAKLGALTLRITVTNESDEVANPLATVLHFTVDGEASHSLSLAFGNGGHGKEWTALEPGQSAESSRLGVSFAETAGDHVIAMSDGKTELARTTVHIDR